MKNECRELFEVWMSQGDKWPELVKKDRNGDYKYQVSVTNWKTWEAAWNAANAQIDDSHKELLEMLSEVMRSISSVSLRYEEYDEKKYDPWPLGTKANEVINKARSIRKKLSLDSLKEL